MVIHNNKIYIYISTELAAFLLENCTFNIWYNSYEKWELSNMGILKEHLVKRSLKSDTHIGNFMMEIGEIDNVKIEFSMQNDRDYPYSFKINSKYKSQFEFWENKD